MKFFDVLSRFGFICPNCVAFVVAVTQDIFNYGRMGVYDGEITQSVD